MSFEFFTLGVSVRLSDRFKVTQSKINFVKNCPQWGLNSQPPDLDSNALTTELSQHSVASLNFHGLIKSCSIDSRNEPSPTCEVVHETKLTSEISCATDSCLAQLSEHWSLDLKVVSSNPTGGIFDEIYFALCNFKSVRLSDRSKTQFSCNNVARLIHFQCSMFSLRVVSSVHSFQVFTNSPQYKNANIAICVLAVPFEIYYTTKVSNLEM